MLKRPLIGIALVLLIIIGGFLIFNIPWGGNADRPVSDFRFENQLIDYADTNVVTRMTASGEINSDRDHREIIISVSRGSVVAEVVQGYDGNVIRRERYSNNTNAYRSFLAGLKAVRFTDTQTTTNNNVLGACPLGQRYYFELFDSTQTEFESWATNCSKDDGTFDGNLSETRQLFRAQVPDYEVFVRGVQL